VIKVLSLLAVSCFSFTLLFNTNLIEASKQQLPSLECDPDTVENCDEVQITSNDSSSTARESSDADQTRPSDSISDKIQDEIQVDQGGKNVPTPPKFDDSKYTARVTFMGIHINAIHEDDNDWTRQLPHGTDYNHDGGEFALLAYVQGQGISIPVGNNLLVGEDQTFNRRYIDVSLPKNLPLSIMTVGYEKDACPDYRFPLEIKQSVINRLNPLDKDSLLRLQKSFNDQINSLCGPNDEKHDSIGYINKVYQWTSVDDEPDFDSITAVSHFEEIEDSLGIPNAPDFQLTYKIDVGLPFTNEINK